MKTPKPKRRRMGGIFPITVDEPKPKPVVKKSWEVRYEWWLRKWAKADMQLKTLESGIEHVDWMKHRPKDYRSVHLFEITRTERRVK